MQFYEDTLGLRLDKATLQTTGYDRIVKQLKTIIVMYRIISWAELFCWRLGGKIYSRIRILYIYLLNALTCIKDAR